MITRQVSRHRSSERGASAVEFAIIAPLFFMLAFGAITGALAFQQRNEVTSAVREGARYGATLPLDQFAEDCANAAQCWAEHVRQVTISRAFGNLNAGIAGRGVCVALVQGNPPTVVPGYVIDGGAGFTPVRPTGQAFCYDDTANLAGEDPGIRVQVVAQRNGFLNAVLVRMNLTLSSDASVQHEQQ